LRQYPRAKGSHDEGRAMRTRGVPFLAVAMLLFQIGQALAEPSDGKASRSELPLAFELNRGQTAKAVHYLARASDYSVFLTASGATVAYAAPEHDDFLRLRLLGANPAAAIEGIERLPGVSNYFIGNDPARWHSGVPNYAKVRYAQAYPGIDIIYYGNQRRLE